MFRAFQKLTAVSLLLLLLNLVISSAALAEEEKSSDLSFASNAKSAILMDADTGTIIFQKNEHEKLPPASITKIMTMLLIMEAINEGKISLDEQVTTSEYAASMGGSQIFLEAGESMSVEDLLKGIAMASGNDASVAMAEKIAGSEEMFVKMMNERAAELGMENTKFTNSNGLPGSEHYSTAHDIAIMSRELLKHSKVTEYTGTYQDYLRQETEKPFWLVNTNKLVRFYSGVDGLKTGYTSEAKFCLAATAVRDDLRLIAVVLGEPSTKVRNAEVAQLFDYGFSQFTNHILFKPGDELGSVTIEKGQIPILSLKATRQYGLLLKKGTPVDAIRHELKINTHLKAPIAKGEPLGNLIIYDGDQIAAEYEIVSPSDVSSAGWWELFKRTFAKALFTD